MHRPSELMKIINIEDPSEGIDFITINKETANELLEVLSHQFIDYDKIRVHELIKRMWEFVGSK